MVIGNPHYNSILRCPNGYSWNGSVNKDGQCTLSGDSDDMKHFMQNVLRYLSNDIWQPNTKSIMTVGTNPRTFISKSGPYWEIVHHLLSMRISLVSRLNS